MCCDFIRTLQLFEAEKTFASQLTRDPLSANDSARTDIVLASGQSDEEDDDDDDDDEEDDDDDGDGDDDGDDDGDGDGADKGIDDDSYEDEDDGEMETGIGFITSGAFSPAKGLGVGIGFIRVEAARRLVERSKKAGLSVFDSETIGDDSDTSDQDEQRRMDATTTIPLLAAMCCPNSTSMRPVILYIASQSLCT